MLKFHTVKGFIDLAYKHSREPKQLSQRSKNIATLQECPVKSEEMREAGLGHHQGQTSKSLFLFFIAGISFTS